MATPPRTALRLSHEEAETSERRDEVEREREREERCAALADMQIEEVGVRYVTSLGEPWLRGQHLPLLYDYFTRAPSSASCRWNRGRKKRRGVEKTIGER